MIIITVLLRKKKLSWHDNHVSLEQKNVPLERETTQYKQGIHSNRRTSEEQRKSMCDAALQNKENAYQFAEPSWRALIFFWESHYCLPQLIRIWPLVMNVSFHNLSWCSCSLFRSLNYKYRIGRNHRTT